MRLLVALICILFSATLLCGSVHAQADTTQVTWRKFDGAAIEKYKTQSDFIYEVRQQTSGLGFWQWLGYILNKFFSSSQQSSVLKIILYLIMIVGIVFIVINLAGIDVRKIFLRGSETVVTHSIVEENIREMNIDELIAEALANHHWRLAVRYQYLKALRALTDKSLINWQPGKTNMDYYYELKAQQLRTAFLDVTDKFEHAWYGNEDVTEFEYERTRGNFEKFYADIKGFQGVSVEIAKNNTETKIEG